MTIEHLEVGPLRCVCTIVADPATGDAIVVDGGSDAPAILERLAALGCTARALVHTHAHFDHVGALADLTEATGAPGLLHPADLPLLALQPELERAFGLPPSRVGRISGDLTAGQTIAYGEASLRVLHTPGHTPGSVCFALERPNAAPMLLAGDTLFRGSIGRHDIGGTSQADIVASIRRELFTYDDATAVVPGHGPQTTIGHERRHNAFARIE